MSTHLFFFWRGIQATAVTPGTVEGIIFASGVILEQHRAEIAGQTHFASDELQKHFAQTTASEHDSNAVLQANKSNAEMVDP